MPGTANSGGHNAKTVGRLMDSGGYRDDRHGDIKSPIVPQGRPDTPDDLDGESLAEWNRMIVRLERCGTLSKVDDSAVYQYAKLFAETKTVEHEHERLGKLVARLVKIADKLDGRDLVMAMSQIASLENTKSRHVIHLRSGRMAIRQYLVEFGMTPSARGRVKSASGNDRQPGKLMSFRGGKE